MPNQVKFNVSSDLVKIRCTKSKESASIKPLYRIASESSFGKTFAEVRHEIVSDLLRCKLPNECLRLLTCPHRTHRRRSG